ncbi:MAG: exodeoxyribonuclease V subunit gamma [Fibrobacter sp.]|nr:exodeoxyribonuclease V subunit gamma [Fibrobacter sp.]
MAIELHFSNHSEELVSKLHGSLQEQWKNPFEFPPVIVQNQLVEKWLKLQWTESKGLVANYRALLIESWLWSLLATDEHERLRADHLELAVLQVLQNTESLSSELCEYLEVGSESSQSRRRVQLAQRMARLFLEYQSNRPLIIENEKITHKGFGFEEGAFSQGLKNPDRKEKMQPYEKWQEKLYQEARKKLREIYGEKLCTLPELWLKHWDSLRDLPEVKALQGQTVHLFGISGLSLFHRHCLIQLAHGGKLGADLDIKVYLLNPCADFWEDVETPQEQRFKQSQSKSREKLKKNWQQISSEEPGDIWTDSGDNALLQQWGQAGRDNIALWCQAADYNIHEYYATPATETLLGAVQKSLHNRQNALEMDDLPKISVDSPKKDEKTLKLSPEDESLRMVAVPGMAREVEVLRERILYLLARDPELKLHEIGVFCPKPEEYRPYFSQIFDVNLPENPYHIPYEFTEEQGGASAFAQGMYSLFELSDQEWKRSQVFAFLRNPLVQATRNFSAETQIEWETWANELNIFNSWNQHEQSWERGIQRLLISDLTDKASTLYEGDVEAEDWLMPWENFSSADLDNRWEFISNLELLRQQFTALASPTKTFAEWAQLTEKLVQTWLSFPYNPDIVHSSAEKNVQNMFVGHLHELAKHIGTCNWDEWRLLCENRLDEELPLRSSVLSGKLMVSTLREARPLPWKHAFVLGMHSGEFPPPQNEDRLDLRWWKPIPGDNNPRRAMQYAFLELLVCVRQSLTLSYQCEDLAKIAPINPSSTLIELQRFLDGQNVLDFSGIHQTAALHAFESLAHLVEFPQVKAIVELMAKRKEKKATPSSVESAVNRDISPLTYKQLSTFLENPLEYTITQNLKLYSDNSKDLSQQDDALLMYSGLDEWSFRDKWVTSMQKELLQGETLQYYDFEELQELSSKHFNLVMNKVIASGAAVEHILRPGFKEKLSEKVEETAQSFTKLIEEYAGFKIQKDYKCNFESELLKDRTPARYRLHNDDEEVFLHITASGDSSGKNLLDMYLLAIWRALKERKPTQFFTIFKPGKKLVNFVNFHISPEEAQAIVEHCYNYAQDPKHALDYLPINDIRTNKAGFAGLAPGYNSKPKPLHVLLKPELDYPLNAEDMVKARLEKLLNAEKVAEKPQNPVID